MRILWFAVTPSLYEEKKIGGWVASLERVMRQYYPDTPLGIAFEHSDSCFKKQADNVTYYPMCSRMGRKDRFRVKYDFDYGWQLLRQKMLAVVEDFKPDVIHCFGSEWPYGAIVSDVQVPVVVHMQGFLNIYHPCADMAYSEHDRLRYSGYNPLQRYRSWRVAKRRAYMEAFERQVMASVKYFMGRTRWDSSIVAHYGKDARYFHCPEVIRPEIYGCAGQWQFRHQQAMQLITVSQASELKGNEIILRTAHLLKNRFGFDFTWRVAGNKDAFKRFEEKTGIRAADVNIELLGFIDAQTIAQELSQAQVYVHPAIIDNSPNSLCEAQLVGCPVVAANVGGIPQLVEDGKTGILYPYNEIHTLAFRLMELCNDAARLESLSRAAVETAVARHAPEQVAATVMDIYETILREHRQ